MPRLIPTSFVAPFFAFTLLTGLAACGPEPPVEERPTESVTTGSGAGSVLSADGPRLATTTPTVDFLARALWPDASIERVLPTSGDPGHGIPETEQILALRHVDLILAHHPDYEGWMRTASLPPSKIIWTAESLPLQAVHAKTHSHGPDGEHSHPAVEPRLQLDPSLVGLQAEVVAEHLITLAPQREAEISSRLDGLLDRLDELDSLLSERLGDLAPHDPAASDGLVYWRARFNLKPVDATANPGLVLLLDSDPEIPGSPALRLDPLELDADGHYDYFARFKGNLDRLESLGSGSASAHKSPGLTP